MLGHPAPDPGGGDQQHAVGAQEGRLQALGPVEVGAPDLDAAGGEMGQAVRIAGGQDDLGRRQLFQQQLGGPPPELPRRAGDDHGHGPTSLFPPRRLRAARRDCIKCYGLSESPPAAA